MDMFLDAVLVGLVLLVGPSDLIHPHILGVSKAQLRILW